MILVKTYFVCSRYEHLAAGMSGGVISTLVLHPLDLLKIRYKRTEMCYGKTRADNTVCFPRIQPSIETYLEHIFIYDFRNTFNFKNACVATNHSLEFDPDSAAKNPHIHQNTHPVPV